MTEAAAKKKPMETIGTMSCMLCSERVPVKEQSSGFASCSCNWCGTQVYCRSKHGDEKLRAKMHASTAPKAVPVAAVETPTAPKKDEPKKPKSLLDI